MRAKLDANFKTTTHTSTPTTTSSTSTAKTHELPSFGFNRIMLLCGLVAGEENSLPILYSKLAENGMTKTDKKSVIKLMFEEFVWYKEAKVRAYRSLVNMVMKRDYEEDTSMSSLRSAAKGLTIFAVPTLSNMKFDRLNDIASTLEDETHTTVTDITSAVFEAKAPKTFFQLLKLIKRFVNLIYALFGTSSHLFVQLETVVGLLDEYGDTVISNMSQKTMASIVWIIRLQARHFAKGHMKEHHLLKPEFLIMLSDLQARRKVTYGDVPPALYDNRSTNQKSINDSSNSSSNKRKFGGDTDGGAKKKPKIVKIESYNTKIQEKWKYLLKDPNYQE